MKTHKPKIMWAILFLSCVFISACDPIPEPLTNDKIIEETNKCENAGFRAQELRALGHGDDIRKIQCTKQSKVEEVKW